jgi:hypothetical protein
MLGIRKFILKDSNDTIPSARKKLQKWVHEHKAYIFILCTVVKHVLWWVNVLYIYMDGFIFLFLYHFVHGYSQYIFNKPNGLISKIQTKIFVLQFVLLHQQNVFWP